MRRRRWSFLRVYSDGIHRDQRLGNGDGWRRRSGPAVSSCTSPACPTAPRGSWPCGGWSCSPSAKGGRVADKTVSDDDVREALREIGAKVLRLDDDVERWGVGSFVVASRRATGWRVWDNPWGAPSTATATEGPASADILAAVHRLRDRSPKTTESRHDPVARPIAIDHPITRKQAIAHLRSLSAEGMLELLREARVCVRWVDDEDEAVGVGVVESRLMAVDGHAIATVYAVPDVWYWVRDVRASRAADLPTAQRAAEDAAIEAGYHVPWRQE